jgi:hypothetical protein
MPDQKVSVNEKPEDVTTFKTTKEDDAYITSNLGKLIDQIFTLLKIITSDFPPLQNIYYLL